MDLSMEDVDNVPAEPTGPSNLITMPAEILRQIALELPPIWLLCLACSCKTMHTLLSFEQGNKIWHSVLPPSLWTLAEAHQNEEELRLAMLKMLKPTELVTVLNGSSANPCSSSSTSSRGLRISGRLPLRCQTYLEARYPNTVLRLPVSSSPFPSVNIPETSAAVVQAIVRKRNAILGSAYNPIFNYKREILGILNKRDRCYLCLHTRKSNGLLELQWSWGLQWCTICLRRHTISYASVCASLLDPSRFLEMTSRSPVHLGSNRKTPYYYAPEVAELVNILTGSQYDAIRLAQKVQQQHSVNVKLEASALEQRRRSVRLQLVWTAEALWEGRDPFPVRVANPATGESYDQPRPNMPNENAFRCFRMRFAPTRKLGSFLFAPAALAAQPSLLPYRSIKGWLEDPTKTLRTKEQFDAVGSEWLSDKALGMLSRLTSWRDPQYYCKGFGGFVDVWKITAFKWHVARVEQELTSGMMMRMEHLRPNLRKGIVELMDQLELVPENALPARPQRGIFTSPEEYDEFQRLDLAANDAERKHHEGVEIFNKIVRQTCMKCPENGLKFYPAGFEGLVEHMRLCHPSKFWEGIFYCLN